MVEPTVPILLNVKEVARILYDDKDHTYNFDWNVKGLEAVFNNGNIFDLIRIMSIAINEILKAYQDWKAAKDNLIIQAPKGMKV